MTQASHHHRPRKRFGQHFLVDQHIIDAIVQAIAPRPGQALIEIGPGPGVLTGPLLKSCGALTVIEIDRDLAGQLQDRLSHIPGDLVIINQDVLSYEFRGTSLRVVGNLPYNISTPLLFHLFDHAEHIQDMHFMLQKEVVDRLVAAPGSKTYGRLSVMAQFYATMTTLFDVPPEAFAPPPQVDSSVIRLIPRKMASEEATLARPLDAITRAAFGQRRKTLRNALSALLSEAEIEAAGVAPSARAETLDLNAFLNLARAWQAQPTSA